MGTNKRVHKYYDKMHDILQRKGYYQIPNDFLMSIFIGGLYHVSRKQPLLHMCMLMREQKHGKIIDWKMNWSYTLTIHIPTILF